MVGLSLEIVPVLVAGLGVVTALRLAAAAVAHIAGRHIYAELHSYREPGPARRSGGSVAH